MREMAPGYGKQFRYRPWESTCCDKFQERNCSLEDCPKRHVCGYCFLIGTIDLHAAKDCPFFARRIREGSPTRGVLEPGRRHIFSMDNPETAPGSDYHSRCMRMRREWYEDLSYKDRKRLWKAVVREEKRWKDANAMAMSQCDESHSHL